MGMPRAAMVRDGVFGVVVDDGDAIGGVGLRRGRRFWWPAGWMDVCGCRDI